MEKQTKGNKTKQHLYQCAMELFQAKGYENVSVEEIVRKAGIAKGTFYIHFHSKVDVITCMLQQYDDYYDELERCLHHSESSHQHLQSIVEHSCRFTQEIIGLDLLRVLYANQLSEAGQKVDLQNNRSLYRVIENIMKQAVERGEVNQKLDPSQATQWIVRSIRGTYYEWCLQKGDFDLAKQCWSYVEIVWLGLY